MDKAKLRELFGDAKDISSINEIIKDMKKGIIELLYDEELKEYLGFSKSENKEGGRDNYRNGSYSKSVKSQDGIIELDVPRDRNGGYVPKIIPKYQGDIFGIEDKIICLYGLGMSTRDISAHIKDIYDFELSESTVSNITNRVLSELKDWQSRTLKEKYAVVFLDGIVYKVKKEGIIQKVTAYIRLLSKPLKFYFKVINTRNKIESKTKSFTAIPILISNNFKTFNKTNHIFVKSSLT